ncbi:hypothetical protein D3C81_2264280 [compost metagenome]
MTTPGPATLTVSALPLKMPVPITPPIAMKLMCLGSSFFCKVFLLEFNDLILLT